MGSCTREARLVSTRCTTDPPLRHVLFEAPPCAAHRRPESCGSWAAEPFEAKTHALGFLCGSNFRRGTRRLQCLVLSSLDRVSRIGGMSSTQSPLGCTPVSLACPESLQQLQLQSEPTLAHAIVRFVMSTLPGRLGVAEDTLRSPKVNEQLVATRVPKRCLLWALARRTGSTDPMGGSADATGSPPPTPPPPGRLRRAHSWLRRSDRRLRRPYGQLR